MEAGSGKGGGVQGTWPPGARPNSAGRKQRQGWGSLPTPPTGVVSDLFLPPATVPGSHAAPGPAPVAECAPGSRRLGTRLGG